MIADKSKKINKQTGDKKVIQEFSANKSETSKLISKLEICTSLIQVFNNRDVKIETKGKLKAETMDKFDYAKLGEMINTSINDAITNKVVPMIDISIENAITNKVVPMINNSINDAITNKIIPMIDKSIDNAINNKVVPMINTSINDAINNKVVPMIEDVKYSMNQQFQQVNKRIDVLEADNKFIKSKIEVIENEIVVIKTDIQKIKECPTIKKELLE